MNVLLLAALLALSACPLVAGQSDDASPSVPGDDDAGNEDASPTTPTNDTGGDDSDSNEDASPTTPTNNTGDDDADGNDDASPTTPTNNTVVTNDETDDGASPSSLNDDDDNEGDGHGASPSSHDANNDRDTDNQNTTDMGSTRQLCQDSTVGKGANGKCTADAHSSKVFVPGKQCAGSTCTDAECCQAAQEAAKSQLRALTTSFTSLPAVSNVAVGSSISGLSGSVTTSTPSNGAVTITGVEIEADNKEQAKAMLDDRSNGMKAAIVEAATQGKIQPQFVELTVSDVARRLDDGRRLAAKEFKITMKMLTEDELVTLMNSNQLCSVAPTGVVFNCPEDSSFNPFGLCNATLCVAADAKMDYCCKSSKATCASGTESVVCGAGSFDDSKGAEKCAADPCTSSDKDKCCTGTATPTPSSAIFLSTVAALVLAFAH